MLSRRPIFTMAAAAAALRAQPEPGRPHPVRRIVTANDPREDFAEAMTQACFAGLTAELYEERPMIDVPGTGSLAMERMRTDIVTATQTSTEDPAPRESRQVRRARERRAQTRRAW